jgi:hypothetical protein
MREKSGATQGIERGLIRKGRRCKRLSTINVFKKNALADSLESAF